MNPNYFPPPPNQQNSFSRPNPHQQNMQRNQHNKFNNYNNNNPYYQNFQQPNYYQNNPNPHFQQNNPYYPPQGNNYQNFPHPNPPNNYFNFPQNIPAPPPQISIPSVSTPKNFFDPWDPNKKEKTSEDNEKTVISSQKNENIGKNENEKDLKKNPIKGAYCEICQKEKHKYRCPNCGVMTCSLKCVKTHKNLKKCDGLFKVEKFISKIAFSEKNGFKDYNYLNGMITNIDKVKKRLSLLKKKGNSAEALRYKLLRVYAKKLHEIEVKFLPFVFAKHRENLSFYFTKKRKIFWSLELFFYNPDANDKKSFLRILSRKPVSEEMSFMEVVSEEFEFFKESKILERGINFEKENIKRLIEEEKFYIFLEGKDEKNSGRVFSQVKFGETLANAFKKQTIIEFPKFYMVYYQDLEKFQENFRSL